MAWTIEPVRCVDCGEELLHCNCPRTSLFVGNCASCGLTLVLGVNANSREQRQCKPCAKQAQDWQDKGKAAS